MDMLIGIKEKHHFYLQAKKGATSIILTLLFFLITNIEYANAEVNTQGSSHALYCRSSKIIEIMPDNTITDSAPFNMNPSIAKDGSYSYLFANPISKHNEIRYFLPSKKSKTVLIPLPSEKNVQKAVVSLPIIGDGFMLYSQLIIPDNKNFNEYSTRVIGLNTKNNEQYILQSSLSYVDGVQFLDSESGYILWTAGAKDEKGFSTGEALYYYYIGSDGIFGNKDDIGPQKLWDLDDNYVPEGLIKLSVIKGLPFVIVNSLLNKETYAVYSPGGDKKSDTPNNITLKQILMGNDLNFGDDYGPVLKKLPVVSKINYTLDVDQDQMVYQIDDSQLVVINWLTEAMIDSISAGAGFALDENFSLANGLLYYVVGDKTVSGNRQLKVHKVKYGQKYDQIISVVKYDTIKKMYPASNYFYQLLVHHGAKGQNIIWQQTYGYMGQQGQGAYPQYHEIWSTSCK